MRKQPHNDNFSAARTRRGRAVVIGYGLDDNGGHIRYTHGPAIELYGGSDKAHREMQRRAQAIQDEIARLGISLDGMTFEQYQVVRDIVERANCE